MQYKYHYMYKNTSSKTSIM